MAQSKSKDSSLRVSVWSAKGGGGSVDDGECMECLEREEGYGVLREVVRCDSVCGRGGCKGRSVCGVLRMDGRKGGWM